MSVLGILLSLVHREPDIVIGGKDNPYLNRWFVIPRNPVFNIYLHQFLRDDDDRALHDHPWVNCSLLLKGSYWEAVFHHRPKHGSPLPPVGLMLRRPGRPVVRRAATAHRVVLRRDLDGNPVPCWSLFLTGPRVRSWGFWCPAGRWIHWRSFTAGPKGEVVGAGCGDPVASGAQP